MVKYSITAIGSLIGLIHKIHGHPQFSSLYQLSQRLTKFLHKVHHLIHHYGGYAGYMLSAAAYTILSTAVWRNPVNVGKFFVVSDTDITNTKQKTHKRMWQDSKDLQDNFNNLQMALKMLF